MALIEAYRVCHPSPSDLADTPTFQIGDAIQEIGPHLFRIELLDPRPEVNQKCTYVSVPDDLDRGRDLLLRVFHEGLRVIAIELVVPEDIKSAVVTQTTD